MATGGNDMTMDRIWGWIGRGVALGGALGGMAMAAGAALAMPVSVQDRSGQVDPAGDGMATRGDPGQYGPGQYGPGRDDGAQGDASMTDAAMADGGVGQDAGVAGADRGAVSGGSSAAVSLPSGAAAAMANGYEDRARSDPDRTGLWTACAAAARKRGTASVAEADAYAGGMAAVLTAGPDAATIDGARSPCPDAIPDALWRKAAAEAGIAVATEVRGDRPASVPSAAGADVGGAGVRGPGTDGGTDSVAAVDRPGRDLLSGDTREALEAASQRERGVDVEADERASLDRLNRQGAADTAAATARIKADLAAGRIRRADYDAAMARYAADKARNDADAEAARQAQADYDREMRAYDARYGRR